MRHRMLLFLGSFISNHLEFFPCRQHNILPLSRSAQRQSSKNEQCVFNCTEQPPHLLRVCTLRSVTNLLRRLITVSSIVVFGPVHATFCVGNCKANNTEKTLRIPQVRKDVGNPKARECTVKRGVGTQAHVSRLKPNHPFLRFQINAISIEKGQRASLGRCSRITWFPQQSSEICVTSMRPKHKFCPNWTKPTLSRPKRRLQNVVSTARQAKKDSEDSIKEYQTRLSYLPYSRGVQHQNCVPFQ